MQRTCQPLIVSFLLNLTCHCLTHSLTYSRTQLLANLLTHSPTFLASFPYHTRYSGHVNRRESVECALSPCLKYLAVGSEDRAARIVDLRTCRELARIPVPAVSVSGHSPHHACIHRDMVSGVAFNPLFPQLATCSFDGTIKFFVDSYADPNQPGI
jgi:WD40 repeat protein